METYYRKKISYNKHSEEIKFQAIEWYDLNEIDHDLLNEDASPNECSFYTIKIFGATEEGHSITCNVKNFTPFFYVKVPDNWTKQKVKLFIEDLFNSTTSRYGKPYADIKKFRSNIIDVKCLIQIKKDFYGFRGDKEFKFLRLTFNNGDAMKRVIYKIKNHNDDTNDTRIRDINVKLPLYEANLDSILRFIHIRDIEPSGWISCKKFKHTETKTSKTQLEIDVDWQNIFKDNTVKNAPILQASFDIETYSHDDSFPSPDHRENCIFQIATAFKKYGDDDFLIKHALCLKKCAPIERKDIVLDCYDTEKELLLAWVKLINKMDPDILYTYNGDQFDCYYLVRRAILLGIEEEFYDISRLIETPSKMVKKEFNSSAYGSTEYNRLIIPGRVNFDILIYMRREYKENSYKLDAIAEKYVGENKDPVTAQMMFDSFREQNPEKMREVMTYCVQDTLLPQKISDVLHILQNQISMSNVTFVPLRFLTEQGQQIKAFSQILKKTRKKNYLVPTINMWGKDAEEEKFTGATVLQPMTGAYYEPITVCDFASLYPSIIQAHNLCYSTIVLDNKYLNLPGFEYNTFTWEDEEEIEDLEADINTMDKRRKKAPTKKVSITKSFTYVSNSPGILPEILKELTLSRKNYKKLMANASNAFEKEIYNKCQLAVKVSMNSIYGFLAAFKLRCKPIAATVTAVGRKMIKDTKEYMNKNFDNAVAVYGDSVLKDTPLLLKNLMTGMIEIKTIEELNSFWTPYEEFKVDDTIESNRRFKQQAIVSNYQIWSDAGWVNVRRVIKHVCNKKIYKVESNYGKVDVTEDHSLLTTDLKKVKPTDSLDSVELLSVSRMPTNSKIVDVFDKDQVYMWGFIFKNCIYEDNMLKILSIDYTNLTKINESLIRYEKGDGLEIKPRKDDRGFIIGCVMEIRNRDMLSKYLSMFYNQKNMKKVPDIVLNMSRDLKQSFMNGFFLTESEIKDSNPIAEQGIHFLTYNTTYVSSYKYQKNKEKGLRITLLYDTYDDYVYDIETSISRFHAGVGNLVVANTDSVFVKFRTPTTDFYKKEKQRIIQQTVITQRDQEYLDGLLQKCIQESIEIGKKAAQSATKDLFKFPINLEYEKVYTPLLMLSKKRYIGKLYSNNAQKHDKVDNKGVILTRRDNFALLKEVYQKIVDIYLLKGKEGNDEVISYIENMISSIENKNIDLGKLVITKSLRKDYKNGNIPHVVLAKKITERDPNNAPKSNDRISYVFIDTGVAKAQSQYTKVEDPEYVKENDLPLDTEYYIKYLMNPLCEIMELFIDNPEKIFKDRIKVYKDERKARLLGTSKTKAGKKITQPKISTALRVKKK